MRRITAVACLSITLAACQPTPPPATPIADNAAAPQRTNAISGTATYNERLTLPAGTQLRVQLIDNQLADSTAAVVASIDLPAPANPPFAFTLPFEPGKLRASGDYGLHASLRDAEGRLWFATDTRTPATPGSTAPVRLTLMRVASDPRANLIDSRWQCGEARVDAAFAAAPTNTVTLTLGSGNLVLPQAQSASGARYADTRGNEFWNKGREATLTLAGKPAVNCRQTDTASPWDAARSRGVAFRAVGNEPGWLVEISESGGTTLHAELDYGQRGVDATVSGGDGQWSGKTAEGVDVALSVSRSECQDPMSGQAFPASAQLRVGEQTYSGCGRFLTE